MRIAKKNAVHPLPLDISTAANLYGEVGTIDTCTPNDMYNQLTNIINIFAKSDNIYKGDFTCYIEKKAFDAFVAFANDVYANTRNEACGVFVGYYLCNPQNTEQKIIVATNFLEAHGPASRVTCEISFDDNIRFGNFCDDNRVYPIVWVHSHPGFGTFYSGTDSDTLARAFRSPHQMGVVVDILQNNISMGFKIKDGKEQHEDVYLIDLDRSIANNQPHIIPLYLTSKTIEPETHKKKEEEAEKKDIEHNIDLVNNESSHSSSTKNENGDNSDFIIPGSATNNNNRPVIRLSPPHKSFVLRLLKFIKEYGAMILLSFISIELLLILLKLCR